MSMIFMPTEIQYGEGSSKNIGEIFSQKEFRNILIVTDKGVVNAGLLNNIVSGLKQNKINFKLFDEVEPDPNIKCVVDAKERYLMNDCDGILAVGGGSAIDTAKGMAVLVENPGDLMKFAGADNIPNELPFLVTVPTTCGTGSEVTNVTVITNNDNFKTPFISDYLIPDIAVLDPELLYTLPQGLVASTGMDALTHAIESYTNKTENWFSEIVGLKAIEDISKYIRPATMAGDHYSLAKMQYASTIAGISFKISRLGLVHAMSHPVSAIAKIPHGVANAILLPYVMAYNLIGDPYSHSDVAKALGVKMSGSTVKIATEGVKEVVNLNSQLKIPNSFKELGMAEESISLMIEDTMKSGNVAINSRKVNERDIQKIYELAYNGDSPLLISNLV